MNLNDFDFNLPSELIAQEPAPERDRSRMMVLDRRSGAILHDHFFNLPRYVQSGDAVGINDTRVIPARLLGKKESGGKVEVLLVRMSEREETKGGSFRDPEMESADWDCLIQNAGKLRSQADLFFDEGIQGEVLGKTAEGYWRLRLKGQRGIEDSLSRIGYPPLPPYIKRNGNGDLKRRDLERYQTVYARNNGAIAAPTAGLHFTETVLENIRRQGGRIVPLTLHVGVGTFLPVKANPVESHRLEPESFDLPADTADALQQAKEAGNRVFAVGTTVVRTLETCVDQSGRMRPGKGRTDLFILPGHAFKAVDALITNFHLPRSTLLMLVSAFAGRERVLAAYQEAVKERYRFYSYGDAMLIL